MMEFAIVLTQLTCLPLLLRKSQIPKTYFQKNPITTKTTDGIFNRTNTINLPAQAHITKQNISSKLICGSSLLSHLLSE